MGLDLILPIGIAVLTLGAVAGLGFVFAGGNPASKRLQQVAGPKAARAPKKPAVDNNAQRRRQVQETLAELEKKQNDTKNRKVTIRGQIEQAGLDLTVRQFWIYSAGFGATVTAVALLAGYHALFAALVGFAAGFGLPRWVLSYMVARRLKAFTTEFANAVDVIVRGVKAGLPVNECLKIVANESSDPVGPEFKQLVESAKIGVTLEDALHRLFERVPTPEVNFFQIVMVVQQKTGGNLSEALGNLSAVLRDRKKMKAKIQAMSSEAKASAMIIGSLPGFVMLMVYLTRPDYIAILFETRMGNILVGGCVLWMAMGVQMMRKMIDFRF